MSDLSRKEHLPLTVLESSGKVDQLRREMADDRGERGGSAAPATRFAGDQAVVDRVIEALRKIFDPEIPVNIYDLGLIYRIEIGANGNLEIDMTLTAPACPMAETILTQVRQKTSEVDGVTAAKVNLVWEPAWTKARMSEVAMLELGLL